MKVLHLTPTVPWPADTGGRIGVWNLIQADARFAQTGILSFSENPVDAITLGALGAVCREIGIVKRPKTLDGVVGGARSLLSNVAMNMAKYRWQEFSNALAGTIARWNPDVIVAHHLHMGSYLLETNGPATILREHNIDSVLMGRYAETLRNPALASFARRQAEQIRDLEKAICPHVRRTLVITHEDDRQLKKIVPGVATAIVPGVLDLERYAAVDPPHNGDPLIVTAGTFSFRPTAEGLVEFVDKAWPRILKASPRARFRVVGHCPGKLAKRIEQPGVEVVGRVDQVRPHLRGAHAFVVPLRVGSGMRMKILESLAWQIPTVSTTIGCEGILVEDDRHLLVADSPEEMAAAVLRLVREKRTAQTLRREGRRLIEKYYSLESSEHLTRGIYSRSMEKATVDQDVS